MGFEGRCYDSVCVLLAAGASADGGANGVSVRCDEAQGGLVRSETTPLTGRAYFIAAPLHLRWVFPSFSAIFNRNAEIAPFFVHFDKK
jgi:hypothetical protein